MQFAVPQVISTRLEELNELVKANPYDITVNDAAAFLHMDGESLRACIENGRCPFALGWKKSARGYRAFKIPTVTFYLWFLNGAPGIQTLIQS